MSNTESIDKLAQSFFIVLVFCSMASDSYIFIENLLKNNYIKKRINYAKNIYKVVRGLTLNNYVNDNDGNIVIDEEEINENDINEKDINENFEQYEKEFETDHETYHETDPETDPETEQKTSILRGGNYEQDEDIIDSEELKLFEELIKDTNCEEKLYYDINSYPTNNLTDNSINENLEKREYNESDDSVSKSYSKINKEANEIKKSSKKKNVKEIKKNIKDVIIKKNKLKK
jgi:hypothetical protein